MLRFILVFLAILSLASISAGSEISPPEIYGPPEFYARMQKAWGQLDRIDQGEVSTYIRSVTWDPHPPKVEDLAIVTMVVGRDRQGDVRFFRPSCFPCSQDPVLDAALVLMHEKGHVQQSVLYGTVKAFQAECIPKATEAEFLRRKSALSPDDQVLKDIAQFFTKRAVATCAAEGK